MLEHFLNQILALPEIPLYVVVFLFAYFENIMPPVPGDTVIVFGAYLVGRGKLEFFPVFLLTMVGSVVGFITMYIVGRRYGMQFFKSRFNVFFPLKLISQVEKLFQRYGLLIVLLNRFLSGMRSVISLFAGISLLDLRKVILLATLSSFIWNGVLIWAGITVGQNWHIILVYLRKYNQTVMILTILVLGLYFGLKIFRFQRLRKGSNGGTSSSGEW